MVDYSNIYLCKPNRHRLGVLNGTNLNGVNLKKTMADIWELTFEVSRYIDKDGELVESNYYEYINSLMEIYLDGDVDSYFQIDKEPIVSNDGSQEIKKVTAHSIEVELQDKFLRKFKINCGTSDSLEYLADNNVDDYTTLPNEYISLINYDNHQLSLLHLALEKSNASGWTVKENIDSEVCAKKLSFEIDNQDIYSFFTQNVASKAKVLFDFDRKHKIVGITSSENIGKDTGVFINMRTLMNSLEINATSDDGIKTKFYPLGANNLGIEYVNFGDDYITNYDYFMNVITQNGKYKYADDYTKANYDAWKAYRESEEYTFTYTDPLTSEEKSITYESRRIAFREISKLYNQNLLTISELTNRLPNNGCNINYKTYKADELITAYKAYNNAILALITIYKNDIITEYNLPSNTVITIDYDNGYALSYDPVPSVIPDATLLSDSIYWNDYYAYKFSIIPQVLEALKIWCETDANGEFILAPNGDFIVLEFGNPYYNNGTVEVEDVYAWKYQWELYGLDELVAKKKAWLEQYNALTEENCGTVSYAERTSWYMSETPITNGLTKTTSKGVVILCQEAIVQRQNEIDNLTLYKTIYDDERKSIQSSVAIDAKDVDENYVFFTQEQLTLINVITREADYSNDNILITSLDDIVTTVDKQEELYQDALIALEKQSQPQYSFVTGLDNLFALEQFSAIAKNMEIRNFIRVGIGLYDDYFVKLRLIGIEYNPCVITEKLSVEYSNMTHTNNLLSDLAYIFEDMNKSSSSSGSSSTTSSGGTFGNNDAEIQISNNILNSLLKSNTFGVSVTDLLIDSIKGNKAQFNTILASSGVFDDLRVGNTVVSGNCLSTGTITSTNWNETTKVGTMLDLDNGTFSYGNGKLTWNGTDLNVNGIVNATDGSFKGDVTADTLTANTSGSIAGWNITPTSLWKGNSGFFNANGMYFGDSGISIKDKFKVDSAGALNATDGTFNRGFFSGDITSTANISGGKLSGSEISGGSINIGSGTFSVDGSGNCIANSLTSNNVNVTGGKISVDTTGTLEENSFLELYSGSNYLHANELGIYMRYFAFEPTELFYSHYNCSEIYFSWLSNESGYSVENYCRINKDQLKHSVCYNQLPFTGLAKRALYVGSDGTISAASSSRRYKQDISSNLTDFDPRGIYDLPVVQYRYNEENDGGDDSQLFIGFIAEDVAEHFPASARWNKDHTEVDTWEMSDMFPALVKLVQEQHEDIEILKEEINVLKSK